MQRSVPPVRREGVSTQCFPDNVDPGGAAGRRAMSAENPLKHLSDDELVAQHCQQGVNTHVLSAAEGKLND